MTRVTLSRGYIKARKAYNAHVDARVNNPTNLSLDERKAWNEKENQLNNDSTREKAKMGINCRFGEMILCKPCGKFFQYVHKNENGDDRDGTRDVFQSCGGHRGRTAITI